MKKISIFASLLLLLGIGVTSCKEDTQPRLETPTEFVLNTPPGASEMYIFRADDKNNSLNSISFTVSQPDYGLGCVPDYQVQVAKSESDFTAWDNAVSENGEEDADSPYIGQDGLPLVSTLETIFTSAQLDVTGDVFCDGVNAIYGLNDENYAGESVDVAVRVHAWIPNASYSSIFSNVLNLKVSSYIPISAPGVLYLIGQPSGWDINSTAMVATETEIGSKIYYGVFDIPEGQFQFRFYSALGDWEHNSIGAQNEDNPVDIVFTDAKYTGAVFYGDEDAAGKGSWQVADWPGGKVAVTIDLNTNKISMEMFEGNKIYIVGACSGWSITESDLVIRETEDGSGIYTGVIHVDEGQFQFRFYTKLGDWETNSIGAQEEDDPVEISMAGGSHTGVCVNGKGSWNDSTWAGGDVKITLDTTSMRVTFEKI